MKICHVLWGLTYGGIETMVVNIANEQSVLGHEVHIFIINDKVEPSLVGLINEKVYFHNLHRRVGSKNPIPLIRLNLSILAIAPNAVHVHEASINNYLIPAIRKHSLTTHHNDHVDHLAPFLNKRVRIISISGKVSRHIKESTGFETDVVLNGIDTSRYKVKENFYDGSVAFKIVQVGRLLAEEKGQDLLIDAVGILRDRGIAVQVDLIGGGASDDALANLIKSKGLEDRIHVLGAKSQDYIAEHLRDYDLLVQPSRKEGFGLTVAEAMAAHVPVLVSDVEALMEVIDGGKCGDSFACGDSQSLADAIEGIIQNYNLDKVDCAVKRVMDFYDVKVTAANYISKYREI